MGEISSTTRPDKTMEAEDQAIRKALVKLQRGIVFSETAGREVWETLQRDQSRINEILANFSLSYIFQKEDINGRYGYAVLTRMQSQDADDAGAGNENTLDFLTSWILVILRRYYQDWVTTGYSMPAQVEWKSFRDLVMEYVRDVTDQEVLQDKIKEKLRKIKKIHIVEFEGEKILIHPVIAAVIDANWLQKFHDYEKERNEQKDASVSEGDLNDTFDEDLK